MEAEEEYMLGAMGDGYIDPKRGEIQVYQKNLEWLEYVNTVMLKALGVSGKISKRDVYWLRKRSKRAATRLLALMQQRPDTVCFVAGLFDSEGSIYLSVSGTPVVDITQSEKGLRSILDTQRILGLCGIESRVNGPYINRHGKLLQYHLRVYGRRRCVEFRKLVPIRHPDKIERFYRFCGTHTDSKL